jgi:hypothetical protein
MTAEFERLFSGRLWAVMSWAQLAALWQRIDPAAGWFLYAVGEPAPAAPATQAQTMEFVRRIDELLRREHREDYCGIVYADDIEAPRFVKIYDPDHLGSSCGSSKNPPLPGWIMSLVRPADLKPAGHMPANRRRWWRS